MPSPVVGLVARNHCCSSGVRVLPLYLRNINQASVSMSETDSPSLLSRKNSEMIFRTLDPRLASAFSLMFLVGNANFRRSMFLRRAISSGRMNSLFSIFAKSSARKYKAPSWRKCINARDMPSQSQFRRRSRLDTRASRASWPPRRRRLISATRFSNMVTFPYRARS